jgi:hypothetical protein|eukprot:COSAG01_NODE_1556_length_9940_cov_13.610337_7_plen_146_part_00
MALYRSYAAPVTVVVAGTEGISGRVGRLWTETLPVANVARGRSDGPKGAGLEAAAALMVQKTGLICAAALRVQQQCAVAVAAVWPRPTHRAASTNTRGPAVTPLLHTRVGAVHIRAGHARCEAWLANANSRCVMLSPRPERAGRR